MNFVAVAAKMNNPDDSSTRAIISSIDGQDPSKLYICLVLWRFECRYSRRSVSTTFCSTWCKMYLCVDWLNLANLNASIMGASGRLVIKNFTGERAVIY